VPRRARGCAGGRATADVVLAAGDGQVVRSVFDEDRRVRVVHAGEEGCASLAEGCH
jgi:hypothetical protein